MARGGEHPGMTVGRRARNNFHSYIAVAAWAIVDDHLLAERFGELRRHAAREQVGRTARRDGDYHADAARRESRGETLRDMNERSCEEQPEDEP